MDWKMEKENLTTGEEKNWWKVTPGQHKIKFLSEGEEYSYDWEGEVINKVGFKTEVNEDKAIFDWGVTKGKTANSLFGQIALVAENRGKLEGETITLVVKGMGKETTYTVLEALALMAHPTLSEEKVE